MPLITDSITDEIVEILKKGGVGFLPSDTIYGLSAVALNQLAVERIYELKKRDHNKPMIVLISDIRQLSNLGIDPQEALIAKKYWPGELSLVLESKSIPSWLHRGTNSLAVRLPKDEELNYLTSQVGPLVSTSANPQGNEPFNNVQDAIEYFGDKLDFYVDVGAIKNALPSTLVEVADGKLDVLREGAVKL